MKCFQWTSEVIIRAFLCLISRAPYSFYYNHNLYLLGIIVAPSVKRCRLLEFTHKEGRHSHY